MREGGEETTVFRGGTILTLNPEALAAQAVAVRGRRILAVGTEQDVLACAAGATVRDLQGDVLVPGFIDAHHHLSLAVLYGSALDCRPSLAPDIATLLSRVQAASDALEPDAWIVAKGFDERQIREHRAPSAEELERASGGHPVVLMHYSYHVCVVSSRALALLGIGRNTPDPPGGAIERNRRGEPTGLLVETAMASAESRAERELLLRDATFESRLARHEDALFAAGVTRVADPTVSPQIEELYERLRASGQIRIPIVMLPVGQRGYLRLPEDRLVGRVTGEGTADQRVGSIKLFADGADACAVAMSLGRAVRGFAGALRGAVMDRRIASLRALMRIRSRMEGLEVRTGIRYLTHDRVDPFARDAVERGYGIAIHAIGNEAFQDAVRLIEGVRSRHVDVPPPRIEHAFLVDKPWLRRAADSGIQLVCQPSFLTFSEGGESMIPDMTILPLRSALEAGLHVAGSSDFPVVDFQPLLGMDAAVTRRWADEPVIHEDEAITGDEALAMYTREAARACGCLDEAGTLEVGKAADLVRLSGDPRTVAGRAIRVVETWVGGQCLSPRPVVPSVHP